MAQISATVNRPYLPDNGGALSCELVVEPDAQQSSAERHISICVDSSGSMAFEKMDQVRDATNLVFGLLNDRDYLSIISFDTTVNVIMEATRWGDIDRNEAESQLAKIETRGGTDIYSGLKEARDSLIGLKDGDGISKRILLLSDGRDINREAPDFEPLVDDITDQGISIYSAGIGTDYGKDLIRTLGENSQGRWAHVTKPTDIRSFFGDVVQEASTVVANNPRLLIEPARGCEIGEAYRRVPQAQQVDLEYEGNAVVVGLPDLQGAEEQRVILQIGAPGHEVGSTRSIATVELDAGSLSASTDIEVTYTDDEDKLAQRNTDVFLAHRDTQIRTQIARADSDDELDDVKDLIDETEVITGGQTEIVDTLRDDVTRIEQGDEEEVREVQEKTTVVYDSRV